MFSALNLNSIVYILDKSTSPKFKIGLVVSVSLPKVDYNQLYGAFNNASTIDLKVTIDGNTYEYNSIPSSYSVISYNNGQITISETKLGIQSEVEALLQNSKQIVDKIDIYKQNIVDCENILKELNPQFAKDKERDDKINNLEERFSGVENKLDKIFNLINK